jgi:3-oxoacyl-[acyl-carrier-protein] synthase III
MTDAAPGSHTLQRHPSPSLSLLSIGHFHPPTLMDNDFLASLDIGVDPAWIIQRVGIRERRTVLPLDYIRETRNRDTRASAEASAFSDAQTGAKAACHALTRAGLTAKDIGMVIAGGCSPQYSIPAQACTIAAEMQMECPAFDVSSACSSFAAQLHLLSAMRPETLPEYILIVNAENTTRTVNYDDRRTAVLWGDGSTAAIVSPRSHGRASVVATALRSDPSGWKHVVIPAGGHFQQDGQAVQSFAIRKTLATHADLTDGLSPQELPVFIGHQANALVLESVCRRAEIPPERHFFNVDRFGNCGAAGAPSALSEHWDQLKSGYVSIVVVGSGLTWGGVLLHFPEKI